MTRPLKAWNWTDPIYDTGVLLFVGDIRATHAKLSDMLGADNAGAFGAEECPPNLNGRTAWINAEIGSGVVVWLAAFDVTAHHLSILVHELHHATFYILSARGLKHTEESEEAFAYHKAWLFKQCFGRLVGKLKDGRIV